MFFESSIGNFPIFAAELALPVRDLLNNKKRYCFLARENPENSYPKQ